MAFKLRSGESLRKSLRRIVREHIENAHQSIAKDEGTFDERIHSLRKTLKRLRATLRLVRHEVGERAYAKGNALLRDAGRPLSELRDGKVLTDLLKEFQEKYPTEACKKAIKATHKELIQRRRFEPADVSALENAASVAKIVGAKIRRKIKGHRRSVVEGMGNVYREGRNLFQDVKKKPTTIASHEWRKQIKYLRYQLQVVTSLDWRVLGKLECDADGLGALLGRDHDLSILRSRVADATDLSTQDALTITKLIKRERKSLQADIVANGELFYRERPNDFAGRLSINLKCMRR